MLRPKLGLTISLRHKLRQEVKLGLSILLRPKFLLSDLLRLLSWRNLTSPNDLRGSYDKKDPTAYRSGSLGPSVACDDLYVFDCSHPKGTRRANLEKPLKCFVPYILWGMSHKGRHHAKILGAPKRPSKAHFT